MTTAELPAEAFDLRAYLRERDRERHARGETLTIRGSRLVDLAIPLVCEKVVKIAAERNLPLETDLVGVITSTIEGWYVTDDGARMAVIVAKFYAAREAARPKLVVTAPSRRRKRRRR